MDMAAFKPPGTQLEKEMCLTLPWNGNTLKKEKNQNLFMSNEEFIHDF